MSFLGAWLVSEYVYNPDGSFAGINRQRRELHTLENGHIRVTQTCNPASELESHALGRFRGEWVFDLSTDGRARRYHGPDVVGTGLTWGSGVMTGRGFWTRLGFNFTSFGMLATPQRQLTGGKFHAAGELKANIVGIAVSGETAEGQYPVFGAATRPEQVTGRWGGTLRSLAADGRLEGESAFWRRYAGGGWEESGRYATWAFGPAPDSGIQRLVCEALSGLSKQTGPMLEAELAAGTDTILELMEILDADGGNLLGLRKWFVDHALARVEFYHLKPE